MTRMFSKIAAAIVLFCAATPAFAQSYPQRPIRMLVGLPAGGSTDIMGRIIAAKISERLGQQVVFENRPGASGIIAADIVAKSQPDGHTLLMAGGSFGTISILYPQAPDTAKDFAPIALFGTSPYLFVVHPGVPVKSMTEFIDYAKSRPGQLTFAGSTPAAVQRLSGELLKRMTGIDMLYVPYKGTGLLIPDLIGGRLNAAIDNVLVLVPHVKSGAVRALAVTAVKRSEVVPELPTIAESGVPGFQASGWFGILAAAKTAPAVVKKLNDTINAAMREPEFRARLLAQGAEPLTGPPDDLARLLAREREVWGKLIREAGIKAD